MSDTKKPAGLAGPRGGVTSGNGHPEGTPHQVGRQVPLFPEGHVCPVVAALEEVYGNKGKRGGG